MPDICKFFTQAFEVSGNSSHLAADIPDRVEVVGRIAPDTIWGYIRQVKKSNKEVVVVRLQPATDEEKLHYASLYSYLSKKNRLGVVGGFSKAIKDFYILPLASTEPVPSVLLPFTGPGLDDLRQHMLLGLILYATGSRKRKHESSVRADPEKQSRTVSPPAVTREPKPLTIGYQPERSAYQPGHYIRDISAPVSPQARAPPSAPTASAPKPLSEPSTSAAASSELPSSAPLTFNFYQPAKRLSESEPETDAEPELSVVEKLPDEEGAAPEEPPSPEGIVIPGLGGNDAVGASNIPEFLRGDTAVSASGDNDAYDPGAATPSLDGDDDDRYAAEQAIAKQDEAGEEPYDPEQALVEEEDDEAYDPGAATPPLDGDTVAEDPARLLAELNRRIAQQKTEIKKAMATVVDDGDAPYDPADPPDVMDSLRSRTEELSRLQDPIIATYGDREYDDDEDDMSPSVKTFEKTLRLASSDAPAAKVDQEVPAAKPAPPEEPKEVAAPTPSRPSDPRSARQKGNLASLTDSDLIAKAQAQLATFNPQVPPPGGPAMPYGMPQPYPRMGAPPGPLPMPGWRGPPPGMGYMPPRAQHPGLCVQPPGMFPPARHHNDPRRRRL